MICFQGLFFNLLFFVKVLKKHNEARAMVAAIKGDSQMLQAQVLEILFFFFLLIVFFSLMLRKKSSRR